MQKSRTNKKDTPITGVNPTSGRRASIDPAAVYRVALFSFRMGAHERILHSFESTLGNIFQGFQGKRFALLPGVQFHGGVRWPASRKVVEPILEAAGVSGLFEAATETPLERAYFAFDAEKGVLPDQIDQILADSSKANADKALVSTLLGQCGSGRERTIVLDGVPFGLLVCGENNILANRQSQGNAVYVRHDLDGPIFENVPVIYNGAHTVMGNWGKLDKRFEFLSQDRRWLLYGTNRFTGSGWGSSTLRAYYDGALVATSAGVLENCPFPARIYGEHDDLCRALSLDIPGRMLVRPGGTTTT